MDSNILGIFDLITLLAKLPNHKTLELPYGTALISDFYFGNFVFLSRSIPESEFDAIHIALQQFYSGQSYQVYCTLENKPFLTKLNKPIIEDPAMIYDVSNHSESTPKFTIIKANISDVDDLANLMIRDKPDLNRESMKKYLSQLICEDSVIFYIARHEGKLVGARMIHYQGKERIQLRDTNEVGIHSGSSIQGYCNLVDIEYRRYGIATSLLMEAMNEAKSKGVSLFSNQTTPDGYGFCKRFGCQQVGSYIYIRIPPKP